ncbi:hypothetical protein DIPPA_21735 [Diplonema papillatum]|nr:hypothetical protein DIPPA_21735 [Diplonema papillatum]
MDKFWALYPTPSPWPSPGHDGPPPAALEAMMDDCLREVQTSFFTDTTVDGVAWSKDKSGPITVLGAKHKKSSSKRFRIEAVVENVSIESVMGVEADRRNKLDWDTAITWIHPIRRYATENGDWLDIEAYTSAPAGGGAISPRLFADGRLTRLIRSDTGKLQKVFSGVAGVRKSTPYADAAGITELEKNMEATKLVRAHNSTGSGLYLEAVGPTTVRIVVLSHMEIGGWLPSSLVNGATAGALAHMVHLMVTHARKHPDLPIPPPLGTVGAPALGGPEAPVVEEQPVAEPPPAVPPTSPSEERKPEAAGSGDAPGSAAGRAASVRSEGSVASQDKAAAMPPQFARHLDHRPRSTSRPTVRIRPPHCADESWYTWKYADVC